MSGTAFGPAPQKCHLFLGVVIGVRGGGAFDMARHFVCLFERSDPFVGLGITGLDEESLEIVALGANDVYYVPRNRNFRLDLNMTKTCLNRILKNRK